MEIKVNLKKHQVKIFTAEASETLEVEINEWLSKQSLEEVEISIEVVKANIGFLYVALVKYSIQEVLTGTEITKLLMDAANTQDNV